MTVSDGKRTRKTPSHRRVGEVFSPRRCNIDKDGNRLEFIDEIVGGAQRLSLFINGRRSQISFIIDDVPITGKIKHPVPWHSNRTYYVLDNGRRCRSLYLDPARNLIGTRHSLSAVYTASSMGRRKDRSGATCRRRGRRRAT
jgi:hypothetical protein